MGTSDDVWYTLCGDTSRDSMRWTPEPVEDDPPVQRRPLSPDFLRRHTPGSTPDLCQS